MLVRKLRLQRGWSQETLAELAGVSVRTIQRIERGHQPALDTAKSLAAVFEVPFAQLRAGEDTMNDVTRTDDATKEISDRVASQVEPSLASATLKDDERAALKFVKGLEEFYTHAFIYVVFLVVFTVLGRIEERQLMWGFLGWGIGVVIHGLVAYEVVGWFSTDWQKRMVERRLGRKL